MRPARNYSIIIGGFEPNTMIQYDLTDDDFIAGAGEDPVKVTRKRQADAYNQVQIECLDRAHDYNVYVAEAKDQWNIDKYGLRPMQMQTMHMICDPAVARRVAQNLLQRALYIRSEYEFTLAWKYARLEPMDLVSLTDAGLGMNRTPVRITSVEEDETGNLRFLAEDFLGGSITGGNYSTEAGSGYIVDNNVSPGNAVAPVIFQPPIEMTGTPEIWLGASGGANWGGAQVWASLDDTSYTYMGTAPSPARFGTLTANMSAGADPDLTGVLAVDLTPSLGELTSVTTQQADALATLSYVDGEILAYANANLTSTNHYAISYLRRGQYGTNKQAHLTGTTFMRLDDSIAKVKVATSWAGSSVYVKLLSFNKTGGAIQSLATVNPHTFTVGLAGMSLMNGVPSLIPAGQYLYVASGSQITVANRLQIQGRLVCYGRTIVL